MSDQEKIRQYLALIKKAVALLEVELGQIPEIVKESPKSIAVQEVTPPVNPARKKHIADLMAIDCWPEAVSSKLTAAATDKDQVDRANAVLSQMIGKSLEGLNFLDFGCGDGWIAKQAIERGVAESHGYDIVKSDNWGKLSGVSFANSFDLLPKSHFDVIMLYDVLDHCQNPIQVMAQIGQLLKSDGVVYVRCHPWTSVHATHVFKQGLNKAYIHLFLTPIEIAELIGQSPMFTRPEKDAVSAYRWWFNQYEVVKESVKAKPVSEFFHVPAFKELLANEQNVPLVEINEFLERLKIEFVDYELKVK